MLLVFIFFVPQQCGYKTFRQVDPVVILILLYLPGILAHFFFQWGRNFTFPSLVAEQTPDSAAAGGSSWTGWAVTSLTSKLYRGGSIPAAGAPEHAKTVDKDKNLGMTKYNASPKTNPVCFSRSAIGSRPRIVLAKYSEHTCNHRQNC